MASRETKEITTPLGHKVVLNAYLNGREANEIKALVFGALKMSVDDAAAGKVTGNDIPATVIIDRDRKTLQFLLVSVDGATNAPIELLEELPASEYAAVVEAMNEIVNPTTPEK